jgi:hypothetical protein
MLFQTLIDWFLTPFLVGIFLSSQLEFEAPGISTMDVALQHCGFNAQNIQYLIDQSFATPSDLLLASESDLESIVRAAARNPPRNMQQVNMFIALKNLMGLRFWADKSRRIGYDADPDDFDKDDVPVFTAKCHDKYNEQKQAAKDEDAPKPEGLKKLSNWALWSKSLQNYLRQILSAAKIPLVYLTRDERNDPDEVLDPENFETPTEYLIEATIFSGRHYEIDNARFYRELKSFTVNGKAWSYIKKFERSQDGRKAYLALKTQCEGTASKITRKNKASASIANATYSGSRRQYKFQDYINTHRAAHNKILDCDPTEAVPESKKVADFLKGITDPKLESPVSVVLGNLKMLNDFQKCQQYFSTTVENRATLEKSNINESVYFGESLPFSLLSPNKLRDNNMQVDERHQQHAPDSIFGISISSEPLKISFALGGVVVGFDT